MLLARRALAEPSVIGDVEQNFRAACHEFAHEPREHALVADERADLLSAVEILFGTPNGHGTNSPNGTRFTLSYRLTGTPSGDTSAAEFSGAPPGVWATMTSRTCDFAARARLST